MTLPLGRIALSCLLMTLLYGPDAVTLFPKRNKKIFPKLSKNRQQNIGLHL
jgi:hypothetical protein